eukprot:TRINITY_DN4173_c0_g1_i2.p1 TRINITY_DN4173_c0_g1~~TRINITY_DN4173_c0_g1_i2.p1  ORF type:complete len:529 (-),score=224.06 TRINITY_DN4173_c0_g1_i2:191-1777(-)
MVYCPECKENTDTVTDGSSTCCSKCGKVLEEGIIVSEISFMEGSGGGASMVGQFVSGTSARFRGRGAPGYQRDSREQTIENARRRIQQVAGSLRMGNHHVEAAQRLYMLAIQHNFIRGRRAIHVVAACLYIVCRRERTPHMLIDFADVLRTNVFILGQTFLKFCRLLNLQLPLVDPSLYIQRFASRLEFEEKTEAVANTALRVVARMRRDWIQTGRRPAGICGAALLIASRLHGFRRTQKEIISVVHVCDVTLRKRLVEFEETPTGGLTAEEFETIDLEEECDPPAYTNGILKLKENLEKAKNKKELLDESTEDIDLEMTEAISSVEMSLVEEDEKKRKLFLEQRKQSIIEKQKERDAKRKWREENPDLPIAEVIETNSTEQVGEEDTFSDIDDDELDGYLNSNEEANIKNEIWTELNRDYLELMAERSKLEAENGPKPPKKRRKTTARRDNEPADSPAEATANALKNKVSARINHSKLHEIFAADEIFDPKSTKMEKMAFKSEGEDEVDPFQFPTHEEEEYWEDNDD